MASFDEAGKVKNSLATPCKRRTWRAKNARTKRHLLVLWRHLLVSYTNKMESPSSSLRLRDTMALQIKAA